MLPWPAYSAVSCMCSCAEATIGWLGGLWLFLSGEVPCYCCLVDIQSVLVMYPACSALCLMTTALLSFPILCDVTFPTSGWHCGCLHNCMLRAGDVTILHDDIGTLHCFQIARPKIDKFCVPVFVVDLLMDWLKPLALMCRWCSFLVSLGIDCLALCGSIAKSIIWQLAVQHPQQVISFPQRLHC